jgi:small-conductance mechanosensitive channel
MKTKFLIHHKFKIVGWIVTIPALVLMILTLHFGFTFHFLNYQAKGITHLSFDKEFLFNLDFNNFTDEVGSVLLITGLLVLALAKEKDEDEWVGQIRLESLLWAVLVNSILLILAIIFFYDVLFLQVMAYNICTPLILFIARFDLLMYNERRKLKKENL